MVYEHHVAGMAAASLPLLPVGLPTCNNIVTIYFNTIIEMCVDMYVCGARVRSIVQHSKQIGSTKRLEVEYLE